MEDSLMPLTGIEPVSRAPEARTLSIELQGPTYALTYIRASAGE